MHIPEDIRVLIEKYQSGTASKDEKKLLNEWYSSFDDSGAEILLGGEMPDDQTGERIKKRLINTINEGREPVTWPRRKWPIRAAAAAVLLLLSASTYLIFKPKPSQPPIATIAPVQTNHVKDIAPGGNKALLMLADGSSVILDSAANGTISQQGNIKVQKLNNGLLLYMLNGKQVSESDAAFYNTISTPRGGQYQVTLSDGTRVWLNAASSIRFPVLFTGNERKVEITGEAYFEVAKNAAMPFRVKAAASQIEVLGTHFNVNAYDDEASIKTTLLEGAVKISVPTLINQHADKYLKPGQQSAISKDGNISVADNADTEEALAWLNGRFQFNSADLKSILRQISRWYDVDVVYNGKVNLHFTGRLTRNENVSKVFEALALTGEVHFKIEDKKIIVSP